MTKKKKRTQQHPEIQLASSTGIKISTGIKLRYLSGKIDEYGTNHFCAVLDETILKELTELKDMKMFLWRYNGKYYLKSNAVKLKEIKVENDFNKDHSYIMDLSFSKYDFQKNGEQVTGYNIFEINKTH